MFRFGILIDFSIIHHFYHSGAVMRFYVLVNSTGIQEVAATELPQIPEIQKLVGIPGEEAFFEAVYGCYSDQSVAVLCDGQRPITKS
jgi:hypothetical protein